MDQQHMRRSTRKGASSSQVPPEPIELLPGEAQVVLQQPALLQELCQATDDASGVVHNQHAGQC